MNFPLFLRVVVLGKSRQVKLNATHTTEEKYFDAQDAELASMLASVFKFSYALMCPADGQLGMEKPDGNWTGMVGMILSDQADIVSSILSPTEQRSKVVDFSFPFHRAKITFIARKPEYSPDISSILKPFSAQLWMSVISCILIMPPIFWLIFKGRICYSKFLEAVYRSLLMKPFDIRPNNVKEGFLVVGWTIPLLFLGFGYTCVLLSYITVPTLTGIGTIPELAAAVRDGTYECVTYPGTFFGGALTATKEPNLQVIGESLLRTTPTMDIGGALRVSRPRRQAFVGGHNLFAHLDSKYFISDEEFFPVWPSFAVRKDFCCLEKLSSFANHIWSSGIYEKLVDHAGFLLTIKLLVHTHEEDSEDDAKQLLFTDILGAFLVLGFGYVLGLLALLCELFIERKREVHIKCPLKRSFLSAHLTLRNRKSVAQKKNPLRK